MYMPISIYKQYSTATEERSPSRPWAESRNPPPPLLGIFVDHSFFNLTTSMY